MTSAGFGSGHRNLHPLWEVLSAGWCLLTVTVPLGWRGEGGPEGRLFCFFPFLFGFMFGFEMLLSFSEPSLPTAALGIGLAGVFPCAGEKQVRGGAETRRYCW